MIENYSKSVYRWLILGIVLISIMVLVGGITRLTHSGLSMVEWKPITGIIPPLSEKAWENEFAKYKFSPEFLYKHNHFKLEDFKKIYFWEYLHRLIARVIGLCFIFPFIYFLIKKKISKSLMKSLLWIFAFGLFQGFLGWFMVKSGLVDNPSVSHYRLAIHFLAALFLLAIIFYFSEKYKNREIDSKKIILQNKKFIYFLTILIIIQITYGAFVSGLKAGLFYNTFPKMGDSWIPESFLIAFKTKGYLSLFEDITVVQFIHRLFGIFLLVFVLFSYLYFKKQNLKANFNNNIRNLFFILLVQATLGILTLLFHVPIILAIIHQAMAILIVLQLTYIYYIDKR